MNRLKIVEHNLVHKKSWQLVPQFCGGQESLQLQSQLDYSSQRGIEFQPSFLLELPAPIYLGFSFKIELLSIFMQ